MLIYVYWIQSKNKRKKGILIKEEIDDGDRHGEIQAGNLGEM